MLGKSKGEGRGKLATGITHFLSLQSNMSDVHTSPVMSTAVLEDLI